MNVKKFPKDIVIFKQKFKDSFQSHFSIWSSNLA